MIDEGRYWTVGSQDTDGKIKVCGPGLFGPCDAYEITLLAPLFSGSRHQFEYPEGYSRLEDCKRIAKMMNEAFEAGRASQAREIREALDFGK